MNKGTLKALFIEPLKELWRPKRNPPEASAVGPSQGLPSTPTKNGDSPSPDDPHQLAQVYLYERARDKGRHTLRFHRSEFWRWNGSRYQRVGDSDIRAEVTGSIKQEFDRRAHEKNTSPMKVTTGRVTNVIQALKDIILVSEIVEPPAYIAPPPNKAPTGTFISMENGLINLDGLFAGRPEKVRSHTPNWFSMVSLPYSFDSDTQCPLWLAFLHEVLEGDQDRIALLQEFFGYCLIPDTSEQSFLILVGDGANGKSVILAILTAVVGEDNVSHVPLEVFGERFQLTSTVGKLVNIAPEAAEIKSVAEGFLKEYTAGGRMYFDRKGREAIHAYPTARLILATNNFPRFSDRTDGAWRRMLSLVFNVTIPPERRDKNLVQKLKAELSGIFNWAVEGERRRRAQGGFTMPKVCSEALEEYRMESNPAKLFLTERVEACPDGMVLVDDLYVAYTAWCNEGGYKPLTKQPFGKEVKRQYPDSAKGREGTGRRLYFYPGIRLLQSDLESLVDAENSMEAPAT